MKEKRIAVALPTDEHGILPRQCPNCRQHFAVDAEEHEERAHLNLRCPYCEWIAEMDNFTTEEQTQYVDAIGNNELMGIAEKDVNDVIDNMFKGWESIPGVEVKRGSGDIELGRSDLPSPFPSVELESQTCVDCGFRFGTLAEGGEEVFCPVCR